MPTQKYVHYKDIASGPWRQAQRKMDRLLFDDEGGRFEPSNHKVIDERLWELYAIMNRPGDKDKERTRFGDKKLPIRKGSHGKYSKMLPGENLAGLWQAFGCDREDFEAYALSLPTHGMDHRPFIEMHRFALGLAPGEELEDQEHWELADAFKAYFHAHVEEDETVTGISFRLFGKERASAAQQPSGENTERSLMATNMHKLRAMICELEQDRIGFKDLCSKAVPRLESLLASFKTDADRDEGEDGDSDAEGSPNPKRAKKGSTVDAAETVQRVDLFFNKLRPPRGTEDGRKNAFKGAAGPHVSELLRALMHCGCDDRLPKIVAPSFTEGADIRWSFTAQAYEFVPPSENPDASTVVTAKIQSLPDEERDALTKAYLGVHTVAKELNVASRELVEYVRNNFLLRFFLHKAKSVSIRNAQVTDEVLCELPAAVSFTQELVLFQMYMHAIFTPKEVEAEEEEEEPQEDSSSGDDSGDEDYDDEASSRNDDDDDDSDDDSDASGASGASDSGSDSDED
jgi:hypothetical protein